MIKKTQYLKREWIFWLFQIIFFTFFFIYRIQLYYYIIQSNIHYFVYLIFTVYFGVILTVLLKYIYTYIREKWQSKLFLIVSIIISTLLLSNIWYFETLLVDKYLTSHGYNVTPVSFYYYLREIFASFIILVFWSSIYLAYKFWEGIKEKHKLELTVKELKNKKLQAELDTFKSQLNPHFLFNVLNNIYSNSLSKSDITPLIVLKLSDLMSYILYDCKTETVPLEKEIDFLKNYIELEKIRLEEDIDIKLDFHEKLNNIMIPPLLFVPLIENAFKHGIGSNPDSKCISVKVSLTDGNFYFNLKNSKGKIENSFIKKDKGGIGIENVKKRLKLLYPDKHKLRIINKVDTFEIEILINDFNINNQ